MKTLTLAGLSALGLQVDNAVDGLLVLPGNVKATNRPNVYQITAQSGDGKRKVSFFVGKKSIEEGMLVQDDNGSIMISKEFETYTNNDQELWIRNKKSAQKKLEVIS